MDSNNTGKTYFRGNLKQKFKEFDTDGSGELNKDELFDLLKDTMRDYTNKYEAKGGK
jgi:hypothetical protein